MGECLHSQGGYHSDHGYWNPVTSFGHPWEDMRKSVHLVSGFGDVIGRGLEKLIVEEDVKIQLVTHGLAFLGWVSGGIKIEY